MYVNVEIYDKQIFFFIIYAATEATFLNNNFVSDFNNHYNYQIKCNYKSLKQKAKVYQAY